MIVVAKNSTHTQLAQCLLWLLCRLHVHAHKGVYSYHESKLPHSWTEKLTMDFLEQIASLSIWNRTVWQLMMIFSSTIDTVYKTLEKNGLTYCIQVKGRPQSHPHTRMGQYGHPACNQNNASYASTWQKEVVENKI